MSTDSSVSSIVSRIAPDLSSQDYPTGALYVIATPIGNIGDISLRALQVLSLVDAVACEDSRNTGQLLSRYGLSKPLLPTHEHNERTMAEALIARLRAGERIAFVSDAGTPAVSDPGARLVDAVRAAALRVIPLPGASAPITALSAAGLVNDRFLFVGFLPTSAQQRKQALADLRREPASVVILEAPHRIAETLQAIADVFEPDRQIVIGRELTKLFEEIHRCDVSQARHWLNGHPNRTKGEFVMVLEGAPRSDDNRDAEADRILGILLAELPVSQAAALTARITGQKKNALYQRALDLKASSEGPDQ